MMHESTFNTVRGYICLMCMEPSTDPVVLRENTIHLKARAMATKLERNKWAEL